MKDKERERMLFMASQSDAIDVNRIDKILAKTLLEAMPSDFIDYGLFKVFGLGHKPAKQTLYRLAKWRRSLTAKTLYGLWRGADYNPKPLDIPHRLKQATKPVSRVFVPMVETVSVDEGLADGIEFSDITAYQQTKRLPKPVSKSIPYIESARRSY